MWNIVINSTNLQRQQSQPVKGKEWKPQVKDDRAQSSGMDPGAEMATDKIHTKLMVH